jgi:hypothetical protein
MNHQGALGTIALIVLAMPSVVPQTVIAIRLVADGTVPYHEADASSDS